MRFRRLADRSYARPVAQIEAASRRSGPLSRVPAFGLVGVAIASVQFGSALAAKLFAQVGPSGAVLLRLVSATIVLLALWRPRLRGWSARELVLAASFGLVLAGMNLSFYAALDRIPLGVAVTIEFVGPLTVAIASSRRPLDLLWVVLAVAGILALTHAGTAGLSGAGILLALLAGCFWGAYILLNARVGRAFEGGAGLAVAMCVAAVLALPLGVADGGSQLLTLHALLIGSAVGMLSSAIPYSLEVEALRRIDPGVFAVLMSLEPAVAATAGFLVLGQGLGWRALLGIALVVLASVGASRGAREPPVAV
jgi:inner membrane transporter RhtA